MSERKSKGRDISLFRRKKFQKISAPGEDRTHDLQIMRLTLYRLSHRGGRALLKSSKRKEFHTYFNKQQTALLEISPRFYSLLYHNMV